MSVHFFHTADWHLGQYFHQYSRHYEHTQFLAWLLEQIKQKQPHALLIAGDIFDVINPSAQSQKQLYQFLAEAHQYAPHMQSLIIAGNHDSGYRIEQVQPLLDKYNAKAIGVLHKNEQQMLDVERLIIPIYNPKQQIVAWCIALPFVRIGEITSLHQFSGLDHHTAVYQLYQYLIEQAQQRCQPDQALIIMSHAHMQNAECSDSERNIIIGHEEALSNHIFQQAYFHPIDYVALGHLHKPQKVGQTFIRYSGSPIPLSFSEIHYRHQVVDVQIQPTLAIDDENRLKINVLEIPRSVKLHHIQGTLAQVQQQLTQLPALDLALEQREYISIDYETDAPPPPNLRQIFEQALAENSYRLVKFSRKATAVKQTDQQTSVAKHLAFPTPQQLFQVLWKKQGYQPDTQVSKDFASLVEQAQFQQNTVE